MDIEIHWWGHQRFPPTGARAEGVTRDRSEIQFKTSDPKVRSFWCNIWYVDVYVFPHLPGPSVILVQHLICGCICFSSFTGPIIYIYIYIYTYAIRNLQLLNALTMPSFIHIHFGILYNLLRQCPHTQFILIMVSFTIILQSILSQEIFVISISSSTSI